MGELFSEFGDLVFTLVIGYISAIEFLYVVRHLYHYSFNHDAHQYENDNDNLAQLQESLSQQLIEAKNKEAIAGTQVMKDGVLYKDGFRMDAQQALINQLKEQLKDKELSDIRRRELEQELAKQMKIAEQLRKELAQAELKYQQQLKHEEELKAKKLLEEQKQREKEERAKKEAEEKALKLAQAEKQKEEEQLKRKKEEQERKQREEAEEQARKLAEAEKRREEEQRQIEEAKDQARKLAEAEKQREEEQRQIEEAKEQARKLAEAEKQREEEQKQREEAEEQARKLAKAEKQREEEQRKREQQEAEAEENLRRLQEAELQKEKEQRQREEQAEAEENARRLIEIEKANEAKQAAEEEAAVNNLHAIEHRLEEQIRAAEKEDELTEKERQLIESIRERDLNEYEANEQKEAELLRKILEAREQLGEESEEEQSLRLLERERDQEAKQKRIEENALLFLEAEKEMADLQSSMLDAVEKRQIYSSLDSAPQTPVVEEPCIKRTLAPLMGGEGQHITVKTQLAQDLDEPYSVTTKPLLFPGVSDDASSIDPASSSFSTQPSEELTTGTESQFPTQERQEPDGEDTALSSGLQYSDDYLRSLDGIKQRPLMREDGSGRRRAFKKRRSSNSSNSSRESRHSRDEELKMFTSLEEEEMKENPDSEFTPIRYTNEPNLKVKGHHRRHKRSPAKDMRHSDDSLRSSLERLGEETGDPWGEVKPEQYKNTEFWKREKTLSIDEEAEHEKPVSSEDVAYETATNIPSASSFEEASQMQNQEALTTLQKQSGKQNEREKESNDKAIVKEESARSDNTNLQTSLATEHEASPARSSASPHLRRSPRIKEINQYEKRWNDGIDVASKSTPTTSATNTPTINVESPLDYGPWRDQHGLMMQGLSDFYDFQASMNPSRSTSPASTAPNTPLPKDVSYQLNISKEQETEKVPVEIYDDTENLKNNEFTKENIIKFIESINDNETKEVVEEDSENEETPEKEKVETENENEENLENESKLENDNEDNTETEDKSQELESGFQLQNVADDPNITNINQTNLVPLVNVVSSTTTSLEITESDDSEMNDMVRNLRLQQARGRSRSKSPLPSPGNLQRSLENRRNKMIKYNEDVLEKLIETKLLPETATTEELEEQTKQENKKIEPILQEDNDREEITPLVQSLHIDTKRTRSKSPMRLPTPENLNKGLEKRRGILIERNDEFIKQLEERSLTPESPTIQVEVVIETEDDSGKTPNTSIESVQNNTSESHTKEEEIDYSRERMELLVQTLREARTKSTSRSPMPSAATNLYEAKTYSSFKQTEQMIETQRFEDTNPGIKIEILESDTNLVEKEKEDDENCSKDDMNLLVQSLRMARSRSRSQGNFRTADRAKTPEPTTEEYDSRHSRSQTPSRSHSLSRSSSGSLPPRPHEIEGVIHRSKTPSRSVSPSISEEYAEFHVLLNLEGSENKTLFISSEEHESLILANRQRQLDEEALEKLRNASDEIELRTLSPLVLDKDELKDNEEYEDFLADLPLHEKVKLLRKSPTTPDYERTISEEMRDVDRIKQEMIEKGFKRSTYVGESLEMGLEFEPLRREAARFQRSRSPSPSMSFIDSKVAKQKAEEKRKLQDLILQELASSSSLSNEATKDAKNTGAIPKTERLSSCEIEVTVTTDNEENLNSSSQELGRSSASQFPLNESKEKVVHEMAFQDFSCQLNSHHFDYDRRASDSALIYKPEIYLQLQDENDLEPEEYHHFRRFSLAQEEPVEQYPTDDYIFIQQVEVRTRSGSRTWLREDFYSEEVDKYLANTKNSKESSAEKESNQASIDNTDHHAQDTEEDEIDAGADDDDEYSNASDDRQTVVEVDDEIDEDISDFNERGPAEESHHETSECEEAEREMDRYADREASDWNRVANVDDILNNEITTNEFSTSEEEGAVGGSPYDSDSFAIDQIYDEAIKNRKQSGILREYDSLLMQMSSGSEHDDQYLQWSKTQGKKTPKNIEFNTQFLDNERKDTEMRYLGDANVSSRQSTRLRSRYGYNPVLQAKCPNDDIEVDLNYTPKKEYNWRKNFKLDEDNEKIDKEVTLEEVESEIAASELQESNDKVEAEEENKMFDLRKLSLGGESITLYSRSPERRIILNEQPTNQKEEDQEKEEKVKEQKEERHKKKKSKKKVHKERKDSLEEDTNKNDIESYDYQVHSRRSSGFQMETDSPKRKSRSRRSSKSSLTNEDSLGLFSPRGSVSYNEPNGDIMEDLTERPKKLKKRKKNKENNMTNVPESPIESKEEYQYNLEPLNDIANVSTVITPISASANILSSLSPQNSVCVTPASIDTDVNLSVEDLRDSPKETTTTSSSTTASSPSGNLSRTSSTVTKPVDTFDILKDANFYPLF